ncbi:MAG: pantoate--beta-alanine ligase [Xanthomonadales bacterium]|nr:Pantothenate synthetase [Xanthomonadales bacterium]MCC6593478.1 pantoate--beta-alanine ligase [Xanthomonadales bacterium]MCE7929893.1 pantoate--beta-alanine ligase [Xanthomonadales bacterium PRO6]
MQRFNDPAPMRELLREWRRERQRIAFVPTMGNLHEGHISLVEKARGLADRVVASVFVNPTQFGPSEDYAAYPRTLERDAGFLSAAGCDVLFTPTIESMYPYGETAAWVDVPSLSGILCGAFRPGHFRGVATVVTRLFNHVAPDVAVFGEKDYQQLLLIRRMTRDLGFPIEIVGAPTARDADGLAMSSRNQYLSAEQRAIAGTIHRVLRAVADVVVAGGDATPSIETGLATLRTAGFRPDYLEVRSAESLQPPDAGERELVVLTAAWLGRARLIDNLRFTKP